MSLYDQYLKEKPKATESLYSKYLQEKENRGKPSKFVQGIKDYAQASAATIPTLINAVKHPWETIKKAPSLFTEPMVSGIKKAGGGLATIFDNYGMTPKTTTPEKVAGVANTISGLAESAFSPITGLFTLASNTPGLKQVADTISIPFNAAGFVGSWSSGKAIDWIPDSVLPPESKEIIKAPIQEVTGLAFMVLVGGKIMKRVGEMSSKGKTITPEDARKIVVESQAEAHQIAISTPGTRYAEYRKQMGYEPYTPEGELPIIQMGAKAKETLPTIQIGEKTPKVKGDLIYEPIVTSKTPVFERYKAEKSVGISKPQTDISRTSLKVQEQAGKAGINVPTADLARIERMKLADEAIKARDLVKSEIETAKDIINKEPDTIRAGSVFGELKKKAIAEGDANLVLELARSKVGTEAGQALKAFDDGVRLDADPVQAIKDIKAKNAPVVEKELREVKPKLPKIEKVKSDVWNDFITNLTC